MNPHRHTLRLVLGPALALAAASALAQTTFYWDGNGTTAGAGTTPSGTWKNSGANTFWNASAAGTGATSVWTPNSVAVFSAGSDATGAFTVTVSGTQQVDSIAVQEGTIDFSGGTLSLTGTTPGITVASGLTTTVDSKIAGANGLVKSGAGTLLLTNTGNSYTGDTLVNAGTLQVASSGNNILPSTTAVTINSGASLDFLAGGSTQTIASLAGSGSLNLNDNLLKVGDATNTTFSGVISDSGTGGTLQKLGTGTLTLSGNSTFGGVLDENAGVVVVASNQALGAASSGNDIASGAALQFTGGVTVTENDFTIRGTGDSGTGVLRSLGGNNTLNATLNLAANSTIGSDAGVFTLGGDMSLGTHTLDSTGAGDVTLNGVISGGSGKLAKDGSGTLTLSGAGSNTFGGTITLNDGTTVFNKSSGATATGGGAITVGDGVGGAGSAVLRLDGSNQIAAGTSLVTVNSDGQLTLNNVTQNLNQIAGTGIIDTATSGYLGLGATSASSTFGGTIVGSGTVAKSGTGTLSLTSNISFGGTFVLAGGTLQLSGNTLTLGTLDVTGNSVIDFSGSIATLNVTNLFIQAGSTLSIINWQNGIDHFYAANWSGASYNVMGSDPMDYITFSGNSASVTGWDSFDNQIRPNVPEPAAYGAALLGVGILLGGLYKHRSRNG